MNVQNSALQENFWRNGYANGPRNDIADVSVIRGVEPAGKKGFPAPETLSAAKSGPRPDVERRHES